VKRTLLLIALQLAANGADAYYTNRNIRNGNFHETDLIAKPFTHGTVSMSAWAAAGMAGTLYSEMWLRHRGHGRWADALAIGDVSGHTYGAVSSREGMKVTVVRGADIQERRPIRK
jgi:hypothetical protein